MSILWVKQTPASVAVARRSVQSAFRKAGLSADDAFDAALIASELVGNSVKHARSARSAYLTIEWQLEADGYLISVTDGGGDGVIEPRATRDHETSGRGLLIVSALACSWGVTDHESSTTVWARARFRGFGSARNDELQTSH